MIDREVAVAVQGDLNQRSDVLIKLMATLSG